MHTDQSRAPFAEAREGRSAVSSGVAGRAPGRAEGWPDGAAMDGFVAAAEAAADAAGAVIRPFFRAGADGRLETGLKGDRSPVTAADRGAERAMRMVLAGRFPDHGLLGEEFGLERPAARLRWVLDPIDGTRAFLTGRPTFGPLVALLDGEVPILGVIDQPVTGERWVGVAGRPTRFRGPFGGKVGCRPCAALAWAELSCTSPDMLDGAEAPRWRRLAGAVRRVSWGGDCYAYGLLALGQVDAIAEGDMKVWDWAALVPVVEGAGGRVTDWEGRPLCPGGVTRVLAVGDAALLPQAVALMAAGRGAPAPANRDSEAGRGNGRPPRRVIRGLWRTGRRDDQREATETD
jgi:histidinol phosphatase-like enzyme (inositol monophosphatase family)